MKRINIYLIYSIIIIVGILVSLFVRHWSDFFIGITVGIVINWFRAVIKNTLAVNRLQIEETKVSLTDATQHQKTE